MEGIKRSWWGTLIHRVLVVLLCIYLVLPFVWMVVYSIYPSQNARYPECETSLKSIEDRKSVV